MTLKRAQRITGLDIQVDALENGYLAEAFDEGELVDNASGKDLKLVLRSLINQIYAINRQVALERAGWSCELCGSKQNLQCHHKVHRSMGRRDDTPGNLQVLCFACHGKEHGG